MSVNIPTHPFGGHTFTSTLYDTKTDKKDNFNYWIVIMTGALFFVTLSWYNFFLIVYNLWLGLPSPNGETAWQQIASSLGYAIIWTIFVIILYLALNGRDLLSGNPAAEFHDSSKVANRFDRIAVK